MLRKRRFYILVSAQRTWEISLSQKIFGFRTSTYGLWNTSKVGDFVAFYVTLPIKKIVGFGKITEKFVDDAIIWKDEEFFGKAIWKFRIKFEVIRMTKKWKNGVEPPPNLMLNTGRKVVDKKIFSDLVKDADSKWRTKMHEKIFKNRP